VKQFFSLIGITGILVGSLYPTFVLGADFATLKAQIDEVLKQAMAIREQVKTLAYQQAVRPTAASVGQKQVVLQVGHWKMEEMPWELRHLDPHRQAQAPGIAEWEVNLAIAQETKKLLLQQGIGVTLAPAILPRIYLADVFISIHADQRPLDPWASGYKIAPSAYDQSGKARKLAQLMDAEYQKATWLTRDTYIPDSMTHYYAFNSQKFMYAIHPKTPSVIIETGYLPNPRDQAVIWTNPGMAAQGIAQGILKFLYEEGSASLASF